MILLPEFVLMPLNICPAMGQVIEGRREALRVPLTLRYPCFAAVLPSPTRFAFLLRSRTSHYIPVVALATMLLAHVSAFATMWLTRDDRGGKAFEGLVCSSVRNLQNSLVLDRFVMVI